MIDIYNNKRNRKSMTAFQYNIRYYIINGILFTFVTNLYKPFAQNFLFRINGNEQHISLYNALPGLVAVFAVVPGIIIMARSINRKKTIALFTLGSRFIILCFAFVPFLPIAFQPIVYVLLASMMNFPEAVFNTSVQSFVGDVFEDNQRARAITNKNKYSTFASFVTLLMLGQIIKYFGSTADKVIHVYQIFFIAAFILGIFEIITFYKLKEREDISKEKIDIKQSFKEIFNNKDFIKFLKCSALFHFGWQIGWPLFSIYQIKYLGADESWTTVLGVTSGIVMFLSFGAWNKIINKKGNHFAIAFATMGMAITPILYALSPNLYILTISGLIMGFFTAGTVTSILNSLLDAAPEKNRIVYVAVHSTITNITLAVAPLIGGKILSNSNIYIALWICAIARFIGSFAFFMRERQIKKLG